MLRLRSSSIVRLTMTRSRSRPVVTSPPLTFLLLARCNDSYLVERPSGPCLLRDMQGAVLFSGAMPTRRACKSSYSCIHLLNMLGTITSMYERCFLAL